MELSSFTQDNLSSLALFWPEIVLTVGAMTLLVVDLFLKHDASRRSLLGMFAIGFLAISGVSLWRLPSGISEPMFNGLFVFDPLGEFFRWVFLGATALAVWLACRSKEIDSDQLGEYLALVLALCLGLNLMAGSTDLLTIYLSLELVSLTSYVLAGFRKSDRKSAEAALKYVIYGGVASGVMLFGMSYVYGLFGTTDVTVLSAELKQLPVQLASAVPASKAATEAALLLAVFFLLAGIGFKVSAVPWHMWCPDVYEGAPTPFTAYLSVGPKAAGFAVALRLFFGGMAESPSSSLGSVAHALADIPWPAVVGVLAAVSMVLGNLAALQQTNLKRLLAYSSIAHAGYLMMGVASGSNLGNLAVLLYLVVYLFMNMGAFAVVDAVARETGSAHIGEFRGLGKRALVPSVAFAAFLFSLTGLPPFAGFIGKFYLFAAVLLRAQSSSGSAALGWWILAAVGAAMSAVSLFFYARVVKAMFLEKSSDERPLSISVGDVGVLSGLAVALVVIGLYPTPLHELAAKALTMYAGGMK